MVRKILFLASNPTNTGRLRLDKEFREIGEGLKRSNNRDQFDLVLVPAVRVNDLRRSLLDHSPRIVHFAGHDGAGGIVVEDDQGQAFQVPDDALAALFALCAQQIECVILNSCSSDAQADAISKHIPYAIGMNASISDDAAIEFAIGFYDALGAGRSIEDAFQFGCNAIALKNIPEHMTPILRKHVLTAIERQRLESAYSPARNVHLDISVLNVDTSTWNGGEDMILRYSLVRDRSRITIQSEFGYRQTFTTAGPISPLNYIAWCPFRWDFPILDFKILNNQHEPLFLTEVIFDVEESRPDQPPLFTIKRDTQQRFAGQILLVNEGWCDLADLNIAFHLSPGDVSNPSTEPPFPHSVTLPVLSDYAEIEVVDAFREEGVDIDALIRLGEGRWDGQIYIAPASDGSEERFSQAILMERVKVYLGQFQDEVGTLAGEISYNIAGSADQRRSVKFFAQVYLANKNRLGIPRPPTFMYDAAFDVQGAGYHIRVPISQTLRPGEADRFTIKIAVAQSSVHRFRATLRDITGATFQSLPIEMECFVPRSRRKAVESRIAARQKG